MVHGDADGTQRGKRAAELEVTWGHIKNDYLRRQFWPRSDGPRPLRV